MALSADILRGYTDTIILRQLAQGDNYDYQINKRVAEISAGLFEMKEPTLYTAFRRLEQAADLLPQKGEEGEEEAEPSSFLNPTIMEEVLGELKDILQREKGVSCTCGAVGCRIKVGYSAVDLICPQCGATLRLPAATDDDLDDLCCKARILLHGEKLS